MALTVQQFIQLSLRDVGRIWPGQTPSTDESNESFNTLQEILGSWSQEGLLVPTHAITQFALVAGTNAYTIGVGATWVTSGLPIKIKGAISSLSGFQKGMQVMPMQDFERTLQDGLSETVILPAQLGYDDAAPMRNVRIHPTPNNSSAVIEISYWVPLTPFTALSDTLAFALPAFEEALRNELTLRLADMYRMPVSQAMLLNAQSSKLALTRMDPSEITDLPQAPTMQPQSQMQAMQPAPKAA